jgi:HNH endonuclease
VKPYKRIPTGAFRMDTDTFKRIPLRNKKKEVVDYAIVDVEDFEWLSKMKWSKSPSNYACASYGGITGSMHRHMYPDVPIGHVVDHINRNGLDNRRANLRVVSRSMNNHNKDKKGEYYGVSVFKTNTPGKVRYIARFGNRHLGMFDDPLEAAGRYDVCAYLTYGEGANTNGQVSYEEAMKYTKEDMYSPKKERDLPNNIYVFGSKTPPTYMIDLRCKEKRYRKNGFKSVEAAVQHLQMFKDQINKIEEEAKKAHTAKPIERNSDGVAVIRVKKHEILVDDDRWHHLSSVAWSVAKSKYVYGVVDKRNTTMHRYVAGADDTVPVVDHINHDRLDNRISNLRAATYAQNSQNRKSTKNELCEYTGVTWDTRTKQGDLKWTARISDAYKTIYIGIYKTPEEAAVAYNIKAREIYGKDAYLNSIPNEAELLPDVMRSLTTLRKKRGVSSVYLGVCSTHSKQAYRARIYIENKTIYLGIFTDPMDGAIAYNIAFKHFHPESPKVPNLLDLSAAEYAEKEAGIRAKLVESGKIPA